jgi:hypothetical protein
MAKHYFTFEYPTLSPHQFVVVANSQGLNLRQAIEVSGLSPKTWEAWLYKNNSPKLPYLERLHRVAHDMGWV